MNPTVLLLLTGCVTLAHVEPRPRSTLLEAEAAVKVESSCGSDSDNPWSADVIGSGVVISERHVLTALHVVACPEIPDVHVTFADGRRFRMLVTREDERADLARLEIFSADRFRLGLAPPVLAVPHLNTVVCAQTAYPHREPHCGVIQLSGLAGMHTVGGNSGSAVYTVDGMLVGIVTASDRVDHTWYSDVDMSWMSGT